VLKIFSVKDSKADVFSQPFFQKSHGEAERSFKMLVADPKSTVSQYPEDFDLYYIGDWDDIKGTLTKLDTPTHIVKATNLKALS